MLDLGLSKLAIIGVVALVVIGPEKLPRVARTAGLLLGRAQRYINDVKSEVAREMDIGDLKAARTNFEDAARNMQASVHESMKETEGHLNETWRSINPDPAPNAANALSDASANPSGYSVYDDAGSGLPSTTTDAYSQGEAVRATVRKLDGSAENGTRRRNWRVKQSTPPAWFKRTQLVKTRLQSGAARVARHRPDSQRLPTRFL
jgi:sec-independent protein translocase protein TatB